MLSEKNRAETKLSDTLTMLTLEKTLMNVCFM